jgi:hypothetical protein
MNAWDLESIKENPIIFEHDFGDPVGTWVDARIENNQLMARLEKVRNRPGKNRRKRVPNG